MPYDTCPNCGEMIFSSIRHRCDPEWHVRLDWHEQGDERKTHATSAQYAAEKYCEQYDARGDYSIAAAGEAKVIVYDANMELVGVFSIEVETRPHYHPKEISLSDDERKTLAHEQVEDAEEARAEEAVSA